jgi:aminopeptidase N
VANGADSLPGMVYVPPAAAAGFSSIVSQRMVRSGGNAPSMDPRARTALDEAFASLMALQWWGNTVTPASFHDQWLSTGLGMFSASVYDTEANNGDYKERWENARKGLLEKNRYGVRPNDAGPVWMGILNDAPKTPGASFMLNAQKGAFVIQMLRSLMWDPHSGDEDFQAMMQDFLERFANSLVSTEDFQQVVEKHMKPPMDLDGNHRMDWFFGEWIYGSEVPGYRLEYSLKPGERGGTPMEGKLTQSGVSPSFRMAVPVFGEFAGRKDRIGVMVLRGNSTHEFKVTLAQRPKQVLLNINHDVLSEKDEVVVTKR